MDRYGGKATVIISGISAPDDVRRHIEDIHLWGDSLEYEEGEGTLKLALNVGGNTAALGALTNVLDDTLAEALDPCTNPGKVVITASSVPVLDRV